MTQTNSPRLFDPTSESLVTVSSMALEYTLPLSDFFQAGEFSPEEERGIIGAFRAGVDWEGGTLFDSWTARLASSE